MLWNIVSCGTSPALQKWLTAQLCNWNSMVQQVLWDSACAIVDTVVVDMVIVVVVAWSSYV